MGRSEEENRRERLVAGKVRDGMRRLRNVRFVGRVSRGKRWSYLVVFLRLCMG